MRSRDKRIDELIGMGYEKINLEVPRVMVMRLLVCARKKYGSLKNSELLPKAGLYALALGTLEWENGKPVQKRKRMVGKATHSRKRNKKTPVKGQKNSLPETKRTDHAPVSA